MCAGLWHGCWSPMVEGVCQLCPLWGQPWSSSELRAGSERSPAPTAARRVGGCSGCRSSHGKSRSARHTILLSLVPGRALGTADSSPTSHHAASLPSPHFAVQSSHLFFLVQFHSSHGIKGKIHLQRPVDQSAGKTRGREGAQTER